MPKNTEAWFIEGTVAEVNMQFSGRQQTTVKLYSGEHELVFPGIVNIEVSNHLRAIYGRAPEGNYYALDVIFTENERPFTDSQREEQARRAGISPVYETSRDFSCRSVLSKITEVESELVRYLTHHPELMRDMHPDAFEKLVAEILASHGCDVEWTGRNRKTAGDVLAFKADNGSGLMNNFIVECKRYSADRPVGIEVARALYGAKCDERFANALLVTTSSFQEGVEKFSLRQWDFQLRDFEGLVEWLNRYRPKADGRLYMSDRRLVLGDGPNE